MWRTEQKVANMLVEIKDNQNLVSKELEDIKNIGDTVCKDLNELNVLRSKMISDLNQLMSSVEKIFPIRLNNKLEQVTDVYIHSTTLTVYI